MRVSSCGSCTGRDASPRVRRSSTGNATKCLQLDTTIRIGDDLQRHAALERSLSHQRMDDPLHHADLRAATAHRRGFAHMAVCASSCCRGRALRATCSSVGFTWRKGGLHCTRVHRRESRKCRRKSRPVSGWCRRCRSGPSASSGGEAGHVNHVDLAIRAALLCDKTGQAIIPASHAGNFNAASTVDWINPRRSSAKRSAAPVGCCRRSVAKKGFWPCA